MNVYSPSASTVQDSVDTSSPIVTIADGSSVKPGGPIYSVCVCGECDIHVDKNE